MRRLGKWIGNLLVAVLVVLAVTFVAVVTWSTWWPQSTVTTTTDAIVCLAGGVDPNDGSLAESLSRAARCETLYQAGAAPLVIFTGATDTPDGPSAAALMANATSIPSEAIVIEPFARSTLENARFTAALLTGDAPILLVTSAYHLPRSYASFRGFGFRDITLVPSSGPPPILSRPHIREAAAIWFNMGRYAMWRAGTGIGLPDTITDPMLR